MIHLDQNGKKRLEQRIREKIQLMNQSNFCFFQLRRRNARLRFRLVLFLGTIGLVTVMFWLIFKASQPPSVQTRIRVEADLPACSLTESDLPSGWEIRSVSSYDLYERVLPGRALGGIRLAFYPGGSQFYIHSIHEILLYRTVEGAKSRFERHKFSYNPQFYQSWVEIDVTEAGFSADQFRVVCADYVEDTGLGRGDKLCHAKARYDRFLSLLSARVSPRQMSMAEVMQTLQTIDKHMIKCVDSYADREWK